MTPLEIIIILMAGLLGYSFAGVAGFGGGIVLMPTLTVLIGPHAALPIICFSSIFATATRAWLNRKHIDWKVNVYFLIGALPLIIIGTKIFISLDQNTIEKILGLFMLMLLVSKKLPLTRNFRTPLWAFVPLGSFTAFIAGLTGVPGPFSAMFFINYGLQKMAYIGTFAIAMAILRIPQLAVFALDKFIDLQIIYLSLGLGLISVPSAYFGAKLVRKLPEKYFNAFINIVLLAFAVFFLVK
jgi:uncharacterized protein